VWSTVSVEAVLALVQETFLARLPHAMVRDVLDGGKLLAIPAGKQLAHRPRTPGVAIVLEGLVRVFLQSSRQRQVTVRYARPGETLGLVHLFGGQFEVRTQAVTGVKLWLLSRTRLRTMAEGAPTLAVAMAKECAARVSDAVDELALLAFGSVRQHVARHLLDLAAGEAQGGELVAHVTQQELADATGSVREVVGRVLKELDASGLTKRSGNGVVIVDAAGLDEEARGARPSTEPLPTKGRRSRAG